MFTGVRDFDPWPHPTTKLAFGKGSANCFAGTCSGRSSSSPSSHTRSRHPGCALRFWRDLVGCGTFSGYSWVLQGHQQEAGNQGPPVVLFYPFFGGRVPLLQLTTEKKGTLIRTSLLEDRVAFFETNYGGCSQCGKLAALERPTSFRKSMGKRSRRIAD